MNVTDPVCMSIDSGKATATERHEGQEYYFCSTRCRGTFTAESARYARKATGGGDAGDGREQEPGRCH